MLGYVWFVCLVYCVWFNRLFVCFVCLGVFEFAVFVLFVCVDVLVLFVMSALGDVFALHVLLVLLFF